MTTEFIQTIDNIKTKKKTSIYELLGLIKDGKAPKKIKYCGRIYEWENTFLTYTTPKDGFMVCLGGGDNEINMFVNAFNDNVEILDEEDEFIDIERIHTLINGTKNEERICYTINNLIANQKKIIERLDK